MAVNRWADLREHFHDNNGVLASNYRLFFYASGSSTKQNTYNSSTGLVANSNPITLNARGEPAVEIWLTGGQTYKVGLAIAGSDDPPASFVWSEDVISGINDVSAQASEWVAGPTPTYISATSFTLVGDQTSTFAKSRRIKATVTAGTVYGTITNSTFGALTTVTLAMDGTQALDVGLSAASYGLLASVNPSIDADMVARKGTAVASAATTDIWSTSGDYVHVTGNTGPITSLGTAPYAGAQRTVIFDSTPTITHNAASLILPGGANIIAAANDRMIVRADTTANMFVVAYIKATGKAVINTANTQPTRQVLTSGAAATYTTPAGATRINVRMVGGGGSGATSGANGVDTTFSTLTAGAGGGAGAAGAAGGAGGTATGGDINIAGEPGQSASQNSGASVAFAGLNGGNSFFSGAGRAGAPSAAGTGAATNSGSGGGSDGVAASANQRPSGGGGGYVEKLIVTPATTYTYTVGTGGIAAAGGQAGAAGIIIVDEYYD